MSDKYTKKEFMENIRTLTSPFEKAPQSQQHTAPSLDVLKRRAVLQGIRPRLPKGMHWMPGTKKPMRDSEMRGMMGRPK